MKFNIHSIEAGIRNVVTTIHANPDILSILINPIVKRIDTVSVVPFHKLPDYAVQCAYKRLNSSGLSQG